MSFAFLITMILGFGDPVSAIDESLEPPLKYTLEINDHPQALVLNKPIKINGTFRDPKVVLKASSVREFTYGHMAFQYPAPFTWEAKVAAADKKTWILSGNDFKIMIFVLPNTLSVEAYSQAMAKKFGAGSTQISHSVRTLGAQKLNGNRLAVRLAGTTLNLEVYALPAESGARLLVLQDSPPKAGSTSKEGALALGLLAQSFQDTMAAEVISSGEIK